MEDGGGRSRRRRREEEEVGGAGEGEGGGGRREEEEGGGGQGGAGRVKLVQKPVFYQPKWRRRAFRVGVASAGGTLAAYLQYLVTCTRDNDGDGQLKGSELSLLASQFV